MAISERDEPVTYMIDCTQICDAAARTATSRTGTTSTRLKTPKLITARQVII